MDPRGVVVGGTSTYDQAVYIFAKIEKTLAELGVGMQEVVRTLTYIGYMSQFDEFARAHQETFGGIDPAPTCIEVSNLVDSRMLVEIEVDAIKC